MPTPDDILRLITPRCTHGAPTLDDQSSPVAVVVPVDDLLPVMQQLYASPDTYCDMLSCVTGIDNGPAAGTMEVVYNLYSIPHHLHLMVRVKVARDGGVVPSVAHIWSTANWHEREVYDMFGIHFTNHPDLRRILMPEDWEGHPLRKDYTHQQYYRDIKVEY